MDLNQEWRAGILTDVPDDRMHLLTHRVVRLGSNNVMGGYVLVVDDDPDAQEVMARILRGLGYEVRIADDGHDALQVVADEMPSLIMLDLLMPRMDGFTFLSSLRGNRATRRVPVVVVTACLPGQVDMLRLPGVSQVIQKGTFTINSLEKLVGELVDSSDEVASAPNLGHDA